MMPVAWIKSIWEARILLKGQWHKYMDFIRLTPSIAFLQNAMDKP